MSDFDGSLGREGYANQKYGPAFLYLGSACLLRWEVRQVVPMP